MKDLQGKSIKELTAIYNEIAEKNGQNTIKKFSDRKTALQRIAKIRDQYPEEQEQPEAPEVPEASEAPEQHEKADSTDPLGTVVLHSEEYMENKTEVQHVKKPVDRTINYRGVNWYPLAKKWRVKVPQMVEDEETGELVKKYVNLGFFENAEEAAKEREQYIDDNPDLCSKMKRNFS